MSGGWLDGDFYGHPKVVHAWSIHHSSIGVWALAVSHAHKWATGGFVSMAFVTEKLPVKREREAVIAALTSIAPGEQNPLWSAVEGGWMIHNFGKRTGFRTAEEERQLKEARSRAGSKGAAKTWQTDGKPDSKLPSEGVEFAISDKKREEQPTHINPQHLSLCEALANGILANDPKAKVNPRGARWLTAARLLVEQDGRSVEEVLAVIEWCQQDNFWRSNILSMPKLRDKFSQLTMRMNSNVSPIRVDDRREERRARGAEALSSLMSRTEGVA